MLSDLDLDLVATTLQQARATELERAREVWARRFGPTVEHYTPLFVTLGAATTPDEPGIQVIDGFWMGLSKRSLQVA